jgi:hypothetical protein
MRDAGRIFCVLGQDGAPAEEAENLGHASTAREGPA